MDDVSTKATKKMETIILLYILFFIGFGLFLQPFNELVSGLAAISTSTGTLISDYMVIGGIGPALVNAGLVGLIGFAIIKINKVPMVGASIAAIFTMIGFALFGKNIWTILPVLVGVFLYSRYTGKKFRVYIYPALYGTALAPLVSEVAFNTNAGILGGIAIGIISGLLIPPLAIHLLSGHEGHNLYNIGFTAGFIGLLLMNILRGFAFDSNPVMVWGDSFDSTVRWITIPLLVSFIVVGFIVNGMSFKGYKEIFKHPGTLVTDFVEMIGFGNTFINMGFVGLIGVFYIELVNGHYNGATVGGLLTVVGFGAFGKHPKNILPVMIGVYLGTFFSGVSANEPGPLLAALFVTTLAPLAGKFGPVIGILAGFTHFSVVGFTSILHGGLNLYNNGFTGGLVATIFVGILNGYKDRE